MATARSSLFRSLSPRRGTQILSSVFHASRQKRRPQQAYVGRSLQWWISRVTHDGDVLPKGREKILTLDPLWLVRTCAATRVRHLVLSRWRRAPSTMLLTARQRQAATITRLTCLSVSCAKFIWRHSRQPLTKE